MSDSNFLRDLADQFRKAAKPIDDEVVKEYVGKVVQRGFEVFEVVRYAEERRELHLLNRLKVELQMDVDQFFFKPVKILGVAKSVKTFSPGKGKPT